jgi:hypothetical protein
VARKKRWEASELENGYIQIKFSKWLYFVEYIYQEMLDYEKYIWRGHRCDDWNLESTLNRLMFRSNIQIEVQGDFERTHLEQFKYSTRGRRGPNPSQPDDENEWWALGQHHGLATPLLDWTTSPFVAAYFAFIGLGQDQTPHRAIYALSRPAVQNKAKKIKRQQEINLAEEKQKLEEKGPIRGLGRLRFEMPIRPEVDFIRPKSDENQRLVNQGGIFTRSPAGINLEKWVMDNFPNHNRYILMKLFIPNIDRSSCLRMLNRMNINHLTLFPDLYGASKFCNLFAEIKNY